MEPMTITLIVWALIFLGLAGTILPGLPGTGLVFGGILLHALYFGVGTVGMTTLILLGVATLFSFIIDLLASLYGAKRFGATRPGIIGSVIGGTIGLLVLSLPGLFLGVFVGAVAGEYFWAKKDFDQAWQAGVGSMLGFLAGSVIKFILTLIMVIIFAAKLWL